MNGCHVWIDTDISGNSCYLTECESLVSQFFCCFFSDGKASPHWDVATCFENYGFESA